MEIWVFATHSRRIEFCSANTVGIVSSHNRSFITCWASSSHLISYYVALCYHTFTFMQVDTIFFLIVLIFSVIIHEISHGYMAELFGDPTARLAGRLTLNPIPHIDPLGSIIIPALMLIASGGNFAFGWAKPVPYNPHNLRNYKWGTVAVAIAGVSANLFLAIFFGLIIRFDSNLGIHSSSFLSLLYLIVEVNLVLAVFNLIPIPPLDGSKILFTLLPYSFNKFYRFLEQNWIIFMIIFMFFGYQVIFPIVSYLLTLIIG